jgi:hypothetical protein|nr:hypothetical protein [Kofleriaceae bacterium]
MVVVLLVACSTTPLAPDVASPNVAVCEGRVYDPCNDASNCPLVANAVCEPLDGDPSEAKVCTVACTGSDVTCPLNGVGNAGTCVDGYCFADRGDCTPHSS